MAFIGRSLFRVEASADVPRTTKVSDAIHPADFDHIAASLRQCAIFHGRRAISVIAVQPSS
jgi:hypothetical protein